MSRALLSLANSFLHRLLPAMPLRWQQQWLKGREIVDEQKESPA